MNVISWLVSREQETGIAERECKKKSTPSLLMMKRLGGDLGHLGIVTNVDPLGTVGVLSQSVHFHCSSTFPIGPFVFPNSSISHLVYFPDRFTFKLFTKLYFTEQFCSNKVMYFANALS